jgi:hypothetical protein
MRRWDIRIQRVDSSPSISLPDGAVVVGVEYHPPELRTWSCINPEYWIVTFVVPVEE